MLSLLLTLSLAAAPAAELRVAAPALSYSNLDPRTGDFFLDALGQQLIKQGIKVTSQKEIAAVLGLERQKQLLGSGAGDASLMELGGAFGADAILTGSLAKKRAPPIPTYESGVAPGTSVEVVLPLVTNGQHKDVIESDLESRHVSPLAERDDALAQGAIRSSPATAVRHLRRQREALADGS